MRTLLTCSLLFTTTLLTATTSQAGEPPHQVKTDSATYAWLKTLVGQWSSADPAKHMGTTTFSLISNGRCIKQTMPEGDGSSMDTIYCDNGDAVVATHYCGSGNQPRFKSTGLAADKKSLNLDFLDATGMTSPTEDHMHSLVVEMPDAKHLVQKWAWYEKGKLKDTVSFNYVRS